MNVDLTHIEGGMGLRWLSGYGIGTNQKVAGSILAAQNEVVSLGKALNPTCLGGRGVSLYLL